MKVALIPCGTTEWAREGRLLGRVELDPSPAAESQVSQWGEILRAEELGKIFYAPDILSRTTAENIGRQLNVPIKPLEGLLEIDLGLWAGLTEEELKKRFAKAHRQLVDSPLNVSPPEGEDFSDAADRVKSCLKKRIKPNGKGAIGLVMRPFMFAMTQNLLQGSDVANIWETSKNETEPVVMECGGIPEPAAHSKH